jgi:hypothetical protein
VIANGTAPIRVRQFSCRESFFALLALSLVVMQLAQFLESPTLWLEKFVPRGDTVTRDDYHY